MSHEEEYDLFEFGQKFESCGLKDDLSTSYRSKMIVDNILFLLFVLFISYAFNLAFSKSQ